jgi:hypothetical protein
MIRTGIVAAVVALAAITGAGTAEAGGGPVEHLVTICHATPPNTAAQGWVGITVNVASVGYQQSGHQDEHDADIIPPYDFGDFEFAGKGDQSILANGCVPVDPPCEETETCPPVPCEETQTCPVVPPVVSPVVPVAVNTPALTAVAPVLPVTGSGLAATGLLGLAFIASGWGIRSVSRRFLG